MRVVVKERDDSGGADSGSGDGLGRVLSRLAVERTRSNAWRDGWLTLGMARQDLMRRSIRSDAMGSLN